MNRLWNELVKNFSVAARRLPAKAAVVAVIFVVVLAMLFASRSDAHRTVLATATLPQTGEQVDAPAKEGDAAMNASTEAKRTTPEQRFAARVGITHDAIDLGAGMIDTRKIKPLPTAKLASVDSETLWLARAVYSETKRPAEMELVAWSIRNRVETGYRGNYTYRDVVLDPWQFSAFNRNSGKRGYFTSLTHRSQARWWHEALTIAHVVKNAPPELRPFSITTRHYYSERSMVGRRQPAWAVGERPVSPKRHFRVDVRRFRFFEGIA